MVKYSTTTTKPVRVEIVPLDDGVEVTLIDCGVEPFDVTKSPDADITLPIEQRHPGGLGLHLIRRMLDSIEYEYTKESRQSRITFRKTRTGAPASGRATDKDGTNASDRVWTGWRRVDHRAPGRCGGAARTKLFRWSPGDGHG